MTISHYSYQIPPHTPPYFIICTVHWAYFVFPPMYTYSCLTFWPHNTSIFLINRFCKFSHRHRQTDRQTSCPPYSMTHSQLDGAMGRKQDLQWPRITVFIYHCNLACFVHSRFISPLVQPPISKFIYNVISRSMHHPYFLQTLLFIFPCSFCKL